LSVNNTLRIVVTEGESLATATWCCRGPLRFAALVRRIVVKVCCIASENSGDSWCSSRRRALMHALSHEY
jgi:hypothetical protein